MFDGGDTAEGLAARKADAHRPLAQPPGGRRGAAQRAPGEAGEALPVARRPPWRQGETAQAVQRREEEAFAEWLAATDKRLEEALKLEAGDAAENEAEAKLPASSLQPAPCLYEHNLEVFRQVWRAVEFADVCVILVDVRFPPLHLNERLVEMAIESGCVPVVALTKCDLVPARELEGWSERIKTQLPVLGGAVVGVAAPPRRRVGPGDAAAARRAAAEAKLAAARTRAALLSACLKAVDAAAERLTGPALELARRSAFERDAAEAIDAADAEATAAEARLAELDEASDDGIGIPVGDYGEESEEDEQEKGDECNDESDVTLEDEVVAVHALADEEGAETREAAGAGDDADTTGGKKRRMDACTIALIGHPNQGKSTLLNALVGRKRVSVSRTPGHTKHIQTIFLASGVLLLDSPGIVAPRIGVSRPLQVIGQLAPTSALREPFSALRYFAERCEPPLHEFYRLDDARRQLLLDGETSEQSDDVGTGPPEWTPMALCEAFAHRRGWTVGRFGRPDAYRAALALLRDGLEGLGPRLYWTSGSA